MTVNRITAKAAEMAPTTTWVWDFDAFLILESARKEKRTSDNKVQNEKCTTMNNGGGKTLKERNYSPTQKKHYKITRAPFQDVLITIFTSTKSKIFGNVKHYVNLDVYTHT